MTTSIDPSRDKKADVLSWALGQQTQLIEISNKHGDRVVQFLSLANGGAAVALATLIGADQEIRKSVYSWSAEGCFFFGIIFLGLLILHQYWLIESLQRDLVSDCNKMKLNGLDPDSIIPRYERRVSKRKWPSSLFGIVSFICFIAGTVLSLWVLPHQIGFGTSCSL